MSKLRLPLLLPVLMGGAKAYYEKVLATSPANLIGYWRLNETIGANANDSSSQNNDGTYIGATLANAAGPDGILCPSFDGSNDNVNIYSEAFNADFNGQEGTFAGWIKVSAVGNWTDGSIDTVFYAYVNTNNFLEIYKHGSTHNQIWLQYKAGGISKTKTASYLAGDGWLHVAVTWSRSADQLLIYINGVQIGAVTTGLGEWAGVLSSTTTVVGAQSTAGGLPWKGWLAHAAVWNTPLSVSQIRTLASPNYEAFKGVLFTFDDGLSNQITALNYMASKGVYGTAYVISDNVDAAGSMTHEQLVALDAAGHLIGNHGKTHTDFSGLLVAEIQTEVSTCDAALTGWGLSRGNKHVAYPYGGYDADVKTAMVNAAMLTGRRTTAAATIDPMAADPLQLSIAYTCMSTTTVADVQAIIATAQARGKYCAILLHGLVDSDPAAAEWVNGLFQTLIDWIVSQGIPCLTVADFYALM